jgi:hypothetical protein
MRSTTSTRPVNMMILTREFSRSQRARVSPSSPGSIKSRMIRSTGDCAMSRRISAPSCAIETR